MPHEDEFQLVRDVEEDINVLVQIQSVLKSPYIKTMMGDYITQASDVHNFLLAEYYKVINMKNAQLKDSTCDRMAITTIQFKLLSLRDSMRGTPYADKIQKLMDEISEYKSIYCDSNTDN